MTSALYLHLGPFAEQVIKEIDQEILKLDQGKSLSPLIQKGHTEKLYKTT